MASRLRIQCLIVAAGLIIEGVGFAQVFQRPPYALNAPSSSQTIVNPSINHAAGPEAASCPPPANPLQASLSSVDVNYRGVQHCSGDPITCGMLKRLPDEQTIDAVIENNICPRLPSLPAAFDVTLGISRGPVHFTFWDLREFCRDNETARRHLIAEIIAGPCRARSGNGLSDNPR